MNKNAIIYARVSTDEQAEKGYSLQSQVERCREYALGKGMKIVAEIKDDYTGSTLDRPGFNELESMLARKEARIIVITEADRLSRNAADTLAIYEEWADQEIELHFCDTGKVNFGEESILVNGMPVLVAQYERMQFRKRSMNGRYNKAKNGKPVLNGPPPYGYRKRGVGKDGVLVKYEPELKVVRDIFEWYTRGNGTGAPMSLRMIARKLNKDGIPSTQPNKKWTISRLHRILHKEIYAGVYYYGKTRTKSKGGKKIILAKLPKEEWIKIPVPHLAVIDQQTFQEVEARKARNIELQLRNNKHQYLMTGHFRCKCGKIMSGYKMSDGSPRYKCMSHWKSPGKKSCPTAKHSIVCHKIDDLAWDWIIQLLTDEHSLEDGLNKMIENNRDETGTKRSRLETLEKLITKRERSIDRLVSELSEGEYSDEFTRNIFKEKIEGEY
jgi:site-specific DNA recombinase